jgi:hypothetical protein
MNAPSVVFVVRPEFATAFRLRWIAEQSVMVYPASHSLAALEAIRIEPPRIVALDPAFIATARGAALIAHAKAEPRLAGVALRVLIHDDTGYPIVLDQEASSAEAATLGASTALDQCGTRRTARFSMNGLITVLVNGERSQLVDLSLTGAQVLAPIRLRPEQSVRITLTDKSAETRCKGVVAWVAAEPAGANVWYRAGLHLSELDPKVLEALCQQSSTLP